MAELLFRATLGVAPRFRHSRAKARLPYPSACSCSDMFAACRSRHHLEHGELHARPARRDQAHIHHDYHPVVHQQVSAEVETDLLAFVSPGQLSLKVDGGPMNLVAPAFTVKIRLRVANPSAKRQQPSFWDQKIFSDAHASSSVPSTLKCSPTRASAPGHALLSEAGIPGQRWCPIISACSWKIQSDQSWGP